MSTLQVKIVDTLTGEEIVRDMTDAELAQLEADKVSIQAEIDAIKAKEIAKAELLTKLGITEDEARLLLG